jgi:hypothetical protein
MTCEAPSFPWNENVSAICVAVSPQHCFLMSTLLGFPAHDVMRSIPKLKQCLQKHPS